MSAVHLATPASLPDTVCGKTIEAVRLDREEWVGTSARPGSVTCGPCITLDVKVPQFLVFEGKVRVFDSVEKAERYIEQEALQREDPPAHIAVTMVPSSWKDSTLVYENRGFVMVTPTDAENWEES